MYSKYLEVCRKAVKDEQVFKTFRRNPDYNEVLEHVSYEQGKEYLKETIPYLTKYFMNKFVTSEKVGGPATYLYGELSFSPTTLRYIKVLSDLIKHIGATDVDIVEIGCGYGGQCKIIHDLYKPKSYTVVDFPDVLSLADKWLLNFKIKPILRSLNDSSHIKYDICISNYAFTEFTRSYQEFYAENIIKHSTTGYITCNFLNRADAFSVQEIIDLRGGKMYEEKPKTGNNNAIYIWNGFKEINSNL